MYWTVAGSNYFWILEYLKIATKIAPTARIEITFPTTSGQDPIKIPYKNQSETVPNTIRFAQKERSLVSLVLQALKV